jgi:hypothetical protein
MRALLLIIALGVAGCRSQTTPPPVVGSPQTSELDVLVAFLSDNYKGTIQSNTPLVIEDAFSISMLDGGRDPSEEFTRWLLAQASDEAPADLIRDFCAKNAKPQAVWPALGERLSVVLLSRRELERLFTAGPKEKPDGWDRFYAKYPQSPGIITISRVGFNRRGDMAMICVGSQSHWLAGHGGIHILHKQDGKWVDVFTNFGPHWVS